MQKCENCLHKKDCIDGANFKNAESCKRFALSDSAIIKALECCNSTAKGSCLTKCPYYNYSAKCSQAMIKDTLDLINRQQAEIERLKKIQQTQADRIIEERGRRYELMSEVSMQLKTAKSEAVKEFAKRLKRKSQLMALSVYAEPERAVFISDIDNLVKEMG